MEKTIAQQLNVKDFPFIIKDKNGKEIYYERSDRYWLKTERDEDGEIIYRENSDEWWLKKKFVKNDNGFEVYYQDSDGFWSNREYDENENCVYNENIFGVIEDNRPNKNK